MSLLKRMVSFTADSTLCFIQSSTKAVSSPGATKNKARYLLTQTLLNTINGNGWLKRSVLFGGTAIFCSYAGYKIWQYVKSKSPSSDLKRDDYLNADDIPADNSWCLSPGSDWSVVAGDAWAERGVSVDPLYGLPPWMTGKGEGEGGGETGTQETDTLCPDSQFTVPAGMSWADICPEEVGDIEVGDMYKLPEVEKKEKKKMETVWGMEVIQEDEE